MGRTRTRARAGERGFTLVELMIVIVLIAILAGLAVYGVRKYILSSKTSEAVSMIGIIKTAQEEYKADTMSYLDVSGTKSVSDLSTFYPTAGVPSRTKTAWGGGDDAISNRWRELGVQAAAPVLFTYGCAAGGSGDVPASPGITVGGWPAQAGSPWYVVKAVADLDGNPDELSTFVGSSFTAEIFQDPCGEEGSGEGCD